MSIFFLLFPLLCQFNIAFRNVTISNQGQILVTVYFQCSQLRSTVEDKTLTPTSMKIELF